MPAAILAVLTRLGQDLAACLAPEAIRDACREEQYRWRDRVLDPVATVGFGLVRVLHRNAACRHLVHFGGSTFSASAYCQARKRLPLAVLQRLLAAVTAKARGAAADVGRWRGHRVWAEDGSSFSMPDAPELQEAFGSPSGQAEGCGFPTARWLVLFDVATGLLVKSLAIPLREQDVTRCRDLAGAVEAGDVMLGDRGFCSYAHLAILKARGIFAVFRTQGSQIVDFTPGRPGASEAARAGRPTRGLPRSRWVRAMGRRDQVVLMDKPDERPPWMTAEEFAGLPAEVEARELEYEVEAKGFRVRRVRLTTTLTDDAAYPASALAELYLSRWRAEVYLDDLKTTMGMDVLRCRTVDGIEKELATFALAYNLVRSAMTESARRRGIEPHRLSVADALRRLTTPGSCSDPSSILENPSRPDRHEPRAVKRRPKNYRRMTKLRSVLRNSLLAEAS